MRGYVAGKTHDYLKVREVQELCEATGHTVTYDWTRNVEDHGAEHEVQRPTRGQASLFAQNDIMGVRSADFLIALTHERWAGTLIEIGAAMGARIPVLLLGQPYQKSVFWALDDVWVLPEWPASKPRLNALLERLRPPQSSAKYTIRQFGLAVATVEGRSA